MRIFCKIINAGFKDAIAGVVAFSFAAAKSSNQDPPKPGFLFVSKVRIN
jgi:hypothetical protein